MLKIGITGGIGSGKTTVCKIFEILGVPVFYADLVAKVIMHTDPALRAGITEHFGPGAYFADGTLNRKFLAERVFTRQAELDKLNALVHPAVFRAFDQWLLNQQHAPYILKEAALLFESGSYKMCDYSILVKSSPELKTLRVMQRDQISAEEVKLRMDKQFSDEQKESLADFTILNDERQLLIPQVLALHEQFLSMKPVNA